MTVDPLETYTGFDDKGAEISKSKWKALRKQKENDEKKAAKNAERIQTKPEGANRPAKQVEEEDPSKYLQNRLAHVATAADPYPHVWKISDTLSNIVKEWSSPGKLAVDEKKEDVSIVTAGRVMGKREQSKGLIFFTIKGDGVRIQVLVQKEYFLDGDMLEKCHEIKRGDIMGVKGFIGTSKKGELSVYATEVHCISPCCHMLPKDNRKREQIAQNHQVLSDKETRFRKRYLDLIMNDKSRENFIIRAKIISFIRRYLDNLGFLEVETPMLGTIVGGATAKPFNTFHNDLNLPMFMRIAPELRLKELVVGGLDRVYEIGKNFRNEGIDLTHNPEFTACEFYMAYAEYQSLMQMTEDMVVKMIDHVHGKESSSKVWYTPMAKKDQDGKEIPEESIELDFSAPWPQYSMVEEIEKATNTKIPSDYASEECRLHLEKLAQDVEKDLPKEDLPLVEAPRTVSRLLDGLTGFYIEDRMGSVKRIEYEENGEKKSKLVARPFFITEHPQIMSPLAKYHRSKPGLTERFELFILGKELANAYTELNNPIVQRSCFESQLKAAEAGDDEAQGYDEGFCQALEHGLPPTGGWGMGIDRMCMFLSNNCSIKEVILFPAMKPEEVKKE